MTLRTLIFIAATVSLPLLARSQSTGELRYFEFALDCGHGNWQDTSVVAAASDPDLIASFFAELEKPFDDRKLINGPLAHGDGGHNRNAQHRFNWHFRPDEWELVDFAFEACSGCPFTDLDTDPVYWVDTLGNFCPWSARPVREVDLLSATPAPPPARLASRVYPNPVRDRLWVDLLPTDHVVAKLQDASGRTVFETGLFGTGNVLDLSTLPRGLYLLHLVAPGRAYARHRIHLQ